MLWKQTVTIAQVIKGHSLDLVLMLLIFYGLQIALNSLIELVGFSQIDIDPLRAGIITLGFIYGAYFIETFRGAYLAVPRQSD